MPVRATPATARATLGRDQTLKLAKSILARTPEEIAALSRANPHLVRDWIAEFHDERDVLEQEARSLSLALRRLVMIHPAGKMDAA